ncbi:hypothetical protein S40288_09616 [Stachybotrys chartarum IBT 40288]|nr:hypothetical protein S40288_09616 [Stachybotrys chartarum IBT 40288]
MPCVLFPSSCAPNKDNLKPHTDATIQDVSPEPEDGAGSITHVPGDPAISLLSEDVRIHLSIHLGTPLLDELYDKLWLVARKSGHNIRVLIGAPSLAVDDLMALGFLRLYALLVPSRLDFALAKEAHLIPDDVKKWLQWSKFIMHFRHLVDERVARRYHYGQLRLSRLNWAVRIFRPRHASSTWFYEIPHWSTADYIARATVPLLFLFASVSLALSAMQVSLSVPTDDPWFSGIGESGSQKMGRTFWVISITVVLGSVVIFAFLLAIPLAVFVREILWGYTKERQRRAAVSDAQVA